MLRNLQTIYRYGCKQRDNWMLKRCKLLRFLGLCFIIIVINIWILAEYGSVAHLNMNTSATAKDIEEIDLSWIHDDTFINKNIEYITLNKTTQRQRSHAFDRLLSEHISVNESFIIHNWKHVQLENCSKPNYLTLADLYDIKVMNLNKLSRNICKWEHRTNRKINSKFLIESRLPTWTNKCKYKTLC
eukprot:290164_1